MQGLLVIEIGRVVRLPGVDKATPVESTISAGSTAAATGTTGATSSTATGTR
jgi:hypothetical protein